MSIKYGFLFLVALSATTPIDASAAPAKPSTKADASTTTGIQKPKVINNKKCPVSGHAVGSMQKDSFVEYKGQKIGLCCDGCKEEFLKNPEAYLEKAKKNK